MSRSGRSLVALGVLCAALVPAAPARGDIDATGAWSITIFGMPAIVDLVQTGSTLTFPGFAGTIDPITGAFSLTGALVVTCPFASDTITGTVAPDGRTLTGVLVFHGTFDCCVGMMACGSDVFGTRCGGATLDPGEQCDDGNGQNGDGCDAQCQIETCFTCAGEPSLCAPAPAGTPCDDGNLCTTNACDGSGACAVTGPAVCDDGSACTVDSCDPLLGCSHAADVRACRSAQATRLRVSSTDTNRLVWKWRKGQSTSQSEFADPLASATYTLCLFAGTSAAVVAEADIPPDAAKWSARGSTGFRYRDKSGTADGIQRVVLRGSAVERTKIALKGKGAALPLTPPPLDLPLTAQLTNSDTNVCWSATYDASAVVRNQAGTFKAKSTAP